MEEALNKFKTYCNELKQQYNLNNNILFINPPQVNFNVFETKIAKNRGYQAYPPTGLQYLSAALNGRDLNIQILDLNYEVLKRVNFDDSFDYKQWLSILDSELEKQNPSIIGVSNIFNINRSNFIQTLEFLKNKNQEYIIIMGGHNATYEGESLLEKGLCHFICKREAENKINYLFDNFYENKATPPTSGIFFKYNEKIEQTEGPRDIVTLEGDLIEEHKKLPIQEYYKIGTLGPFSKLAGKDTPYATIVFNRGCFGNCRFCSVRDYMGKGVRSRSIEDVLSEITYLYDEKGIRHFEILDDDTTRYKDKVSEILSGIKQRGLNITWAAQNGLIANTLNDKILEEMVDSNCLGFKVGIESGNQEILKKIKKPGTLKSFKEFSEKIQRFPELMIPLNYIIGFPDETFSQIMDTFNFSGEMNSDWSAFSIYQHSVNYFGERKKGEDISDSEENFIPPKSSLGWEVSSAEEVLEGPDIFNLPLEQVPSNEQLKQIWFSFNLIRNFIQNKNLRQDGRQDKFIKWVNVLQENYPLNPYMPFFLLLAHQSIGNKKEAEKYYKLTQENLNDEYWKKRFNQFGLTEIVNNFPENPKKANDSLNFLRQKYIKYA